MVKPLEAGLFGMVSGDGNGDGGVDGSDKNVVWRPQNGTLGLTPSWETSIWTAAMTPSI